MLNVYQKRKLQRVLYSRFVLVALCVPLGFLGYVAWGAWDTERLTNERRVALAEQLAALEVRAGALERDLAVLENPRDIELELRRRYHVGAAGEEEYVFVEDPSDVREEAQPDAPPPAKGWWERLCGWLQ